MKKKVTKITVGTRITIPLKEELEAAALEYDLSFCAYLEHLLINRDNTSDSYVYALKQDLEFIQKERDDLMEEMEALQETITDLQSNESPETAHQDLLDRIEDLENQVVELEEENELFHSLPPDEADIEITNDEAINTVEAEANQTILKELESEKAELESENEILKQQIGQLQMVEELPAPNFDTDALQFLKEKHPSLSTEEIIKTALDCSATNEGVWLTVYSFTDYVNRGKSFINYQNN